MPIELDEYQKKLAKWQTDNFPPEKSDLVRMALGCCEEAGEFAHWALKFDQKIRGVDEEKVKKELADAFGDIVVYAMQALNKVGVSPEESLRICFETVLQRNWKANPDGIGVSQHKQG
jgi:NTP pyrophosphatase (non-canonical NTP hydrolase)